MPRKPRPFSENQKPSSTRSGCTIGITLIGVITFLIGWSVYTFVRQDRAIARFTTDSPVELAVPAPEPARAAALLGRVKAFGESSPATLELTVDDLNSLLATLPELASVNGIVRFESIDAGTVNASVSLPLRKLGSQSPRYLNGSVKFTPRATDGQFFFDLASMAATGAEIDTGFVTNYRNERYLDSLLLHPFQADKEAWSAIQSITSVEVGEGVVTLGRAARDR